MLLKNKKFALLVALVLPVVVYADSLLPELPKAKKNYSEETKCVEPVAVMREDHMSLILHQRNETMRKGIRTKQHSLEECIDCHNAPAEDGKVARAGESEHFCSSCHNFAAVKIDCFSCHSDKPENTQYRHKLSAQGISYHMDIAAHQLTSDNIELLTGNNKESQQ